MIEILRLAKKAHDSRLEWLRTMRPDTTHVFRRGKMQFYRNPFPSEMTLHSPNGFQGFCNLVRRSCFCHGKIFFERINLPWRLLRHGAKPALYYCSRILIVSSTPLMQGMGSWLMGIETKLVRIFAKFLTNHLCEIGKDAIHGDVGAGKL